MSKWQVVIFLGGEREIFSCFSFFQGRPPSMTCQNDMSKWQTIRVNFSVLASKVRVRKPLFLVGGKCLILKEILANIPPHRTYIEPFGGGATLLFAKEPSPVEILNDKDDRLVTFYRVLQDETKTKRLLRKILYTPISDTEFARAKEVLNNRENYDEIEIAHAVFVVINLSSQHKMDLNEKRLPLAFAQPIKKFVRAKENIVFAYARLQKVQITNRDAIELIERSDRPDTFIFCDPPYLNAKAHYAHKADEAFHKKLVDVLNNLKHAKVMLTGYDHEIYQKELANWRRIEKEVPCNQWCISHKNKEKETEPTRRSKRTEVIFMNYDLTK